MKLRPIHYVLLARVAKKPGRDVDAVTDEGSVRSSQMGALRALRTAGLIQTTGAFANENTLTLHGRRVLNAFRDGYKSAVANAAAAKKEAARS